MWIQYDTGKPTMQWENSETTEIISSGGNDKRYPGFKEKLDSGEVVPVLFEETAAYTEGVVKQEAFKEKMWRNNELVRMDIEYNIRRRRGGDTQAVDVYAELLCDWDSKNADYPDVSKRPQLAVLAV